MKKSLAIIVILICAILIVSLCGCSKDKTVLDESMSKLEVREALLGTNSYTYESFELEDRDYYKTVYYIEKHAYAYEVYENDRLIVFVAYFIEDDKLYELSYAYDEEYNRETTSAHYYEDLSEFLEINYINHFATLVYEDLLKTNSYQIKDNKLSFDESGVSYIVRNINKSKISIPSQLANYKQRAVKG